MQLDSDLAPFYGPATEHAAGMSRATLLELRAFFDKKKAELDRIVPGCADCVHLGGKSGAGFVCKHYGAAIPGNYAGDDCESWAWNGIPF